VIVQNQGVSRGAARDAANLAAIAIEHREVAI
jgi:hypothetical protein